MAAWLARKEKEQNDALASLLAFQMTPTAPAPPVQRMPAPPVAPTPPNPAPYAPVTTQPPPYVPRPVAPTLPPTQPVAPTVYVPPRVVPPPLPPAPVTSQRKGKKGGRMKGGFSFFPPMQATPAILRPSTPAMPLPPPPRFAPVYPIMRPTFPIAGPALPPNQRPTVLPGLGMGPFGSATVTAADPSMYPGMGSSGIVSPLIQPSMSSFRLPSVLKGRGKSSKKKEKELMEVLALHSAMESMF
jgi:hypothetical protein